MRTIGFWAMFSRMVCAGLLLTLASCASLGPDSQKLPSGVESNAAAVISEAELRESVEAVKNAQFPAGEGGVSEAYVIRIAKDTSVYRLWDGPGAKDNRLGPWWTFDAPTGSETEYRKHYEVCGSFNRLSWVAHCTLKKGSLVVVGPGQSVSPATCKNPGESYPEDSSHWQVYIFHAWERPDVLVCPDKTADYRADPMALQRRFADPGGSH